jgi:II/X family phage/plasmid replication protein
MSEIQAMKVQKLMGLDTVRLKTPSMSKQDVDRVNEQGISFQRVRMATGEFTKEPFTVTDLQGSFDARIMVKPMYHDWEKSKSGKLELHPSRPYLIIECSIPKAFHGQNIYGAIEDFQDACARLQGLIERLTGVTLPPVAKWVVQRIDWAENFALPYQAVQEFFEGVYHIGFPRRKMQKHGNQSIFTPGSTTTVKLYHKGPEFEKHDRKHLYMVYRAAYQACRTKREKPNWAHEQASRKVNALQRLANMRLRAEVEIHAEKFNYDFGHMPKVSEITTEYLQAVFDKEMARLLREGAASIGKVRTSLAVRDRLESRYTPELAGLLHGFWFGLATHGEEDMKARSPRATFYRRRKQLVDSGVSWIGTDQQLIERQGQMLPVDFSPVRADPRRCKSLVRERPAFNFERGLPQLAA